MDDNSYNPFKTRYPNRLKIIKGKNDYGGDLIKEAKAKNLTKNIASLNDNNKKLNLFVNGIKLYDNEINFSEKFINYGKIPSQIQKNLNNMGIEILTPIQKLFFGYLFNSGNKFFDNNNKNNNYDLVGCAQTGSGKTLAYLIPSLSFLFSDTEGILEIPKNKLSNISNKSKYISYPLILIILPTRELAIQTFEECLKLLHNTFINTVVVYGGEKIFSQKCELQEGCDIVIGTPGRLIQFLEEGDISLNQVKFLVIDEADKLLDMGFEEDINHILYDFNWSEYFNIFLMSATFPKKVLNMVERLMKSKDYSFITHGNYLGEKEDANGNVKQRFYLIENDYYTNIFDKKMDALFGLLKILDGKTLIFANKKGDVKEIEYRINNYGYGVVSLHGDMEMNERKYSLNEFKEGNINLMVASDVASRGLDIPDVSYVINFDMPNNIDIYVHRIGRTGRVGNQGNSLTFLTKDDSYLFRGLFELLCKTKQKIPDFLNLGY